MKVNSRYLQRLLTPALAVGEAAASSILFKGATIIAFNDTIQDVEILRNASLLVENDRITRLVNGSSSVADDLASSASSKNVTVVDATGKIISPGFVDTHHHLWQTALKTIGSNTTLAEYYLRYSEFSQAEQVFNADDIYLGQLTGSLELIHEGTTTVLDHAHGDFSYDTAYASLNGSLDSGLRTFYAHTIHPIQNGFSIDDQLKLFDTFAADPRVQSKDGSGSGESLISLGLAYDQFNHPQVTDLGALWALVQSHNLSVVTSHYLGGPWGNANSPEMLEALGWLNGSVPIVFSHASFASKTDHYLLRERNQYISNTPESEQHYGHGHPWSREIQDQSALGLDTHFTYSGGMVQQARSWLQSVRLDVMVDQNIKPEWKVPVNSPMSVKQAFNMITRHGGLALRRDDIGVLREGAKADLVVFDGSSPNMLGWYDPIAAVILHSNVGDIEHVLIDGDFVKKDGKLTYNDYPTIQKRFLASAERIQNVWLNTEWPSLLGDTLKGRLDDVVELTTAETVDTFRGNGTGY